MKPIHTNAVDFLFTGIKRCAKPRFSRWVLAIFVFSSVLLFSAPAIAQENVHIVRRGESLAMIARQYNVSINDMIVSNGLANPNVIYVGQRLIVPGSIGAAGIYGAPARQGRLPGSDGYYVVRRGDTLSQIAKRHGMSSADLLRLNGLSNPNFVWVGQKLRVSARVAPASAEKSPAPQLANNIYVVAAGDTLSEIAQKFNTTPQALLAANGLPNANFVWVGQRLRIKVAPVDNTLGVAGAPPNGTRWIEINLSNQTLIAWQGDVPVLQTNISSGTRYFPTVTGRFKIGTKYSAQRMTGPGYDLPGVPWVMYFYSGYAIHGAYWHNNFGVPMSHGCVNMRVGEAEMLYNWAPAGTEVYVHH
jgi:LysM repeat protein